jgi:glucose-fructose oxidoreductase
MKRQGRVRYAVIGLGHIAQVAVLPAFQHARRNSELAALVSDDPAKLSQLSRRHRVKRCCDYDGLEDLYASDEIDAVYIALPNSMHEAHTRRAARAGVHVLCEKPMADSVAACERMIAETRDHGVRLMVAYRLHFERATLEALALARPSSRSRNGGSSPRPGRLGDLRFFSSEFSMQVADDNHTRLDRDLGGGPLQDIGIYCINAARAVFAAEPVDVWATAATRGDGEKFAEVPASVAAVLRFPEQRVASFTCSFDAADRSVYTVVGTKGSLTMEPAFEYAEGLAYQVRVGERTGRKKFRKSDQFAPELLYFSDCILRNREPEPSGEEGLADLRVIEALERSIEKGKPVPLGEPPPDVQRPSLDQERRRPPVAKPQTVHARAPH